MSGILMMILALVVLGGAYLIYGRYLAKTWGIDPNAKTPAYELEDGVDYVPADTNVVFGHQFASIAGAAPINGPIQAAIFGWLPVLLWILIGGVFFGAVQDFVSMYASVKNKGRTIGYIIEAYIGKLGKKLFLMFCCWCWAFWWPSRACRSSSEKSLSRRLSDKFKKSGGLPFFWQPSQSAFRGGIFSSGALFSGTGGEVLRTPTPGRPGCWNPRGKSAERN